MNRRKKIAVIIAPVFAVLLVISLLGFLKFDKTRNQALTPPPGWNSFDSNGAYLYEEAAMANLEAMAEKLKPFGYEYFVIDGGWVGVFNRNSEKVEEPDSSEFKDSELWSAGVHSHAGRSLENRKRDMALYYGMVSFMDQEIGKILDKLDQLGLTKNTVVVFTSDHGNVYGQHGLIKKGPFMYEDLVKVPCIVSCPDIIPEGSRSQSLQSLIDLSPTFLSLAGIEIPGSMTGIDQKKVWSGQTETIRNNVVVENHQQPYCLYQKQLISEQYKITVYMNHSYGELFDLKNDPEELKNLWDKPGYSEIKMKLLLELMLSEMRQEPLVVERTADA